ncbi:MAG TPA: Gldg family protein [Gemmataceae bacterium]|jgi:hypothetical protein
MMNPQAPTSTNAAVQQPVVEYIRGQRQKAAYFFLGLSALFLVGAIALGYRSFGMSAAVPKSEAKKSEEAEPKKMDSAKAEIPDPKKRDFTVGLIGAVFGFLVMGGVGVYLQATPPRSEPDAQRTEARVVLLIAGGLIGFALIIFGGWYFYLWSESIPNWLDKGEGKEMKWVVIPLMAVLVGGALVFFAVQPARAEERNKASLRRLVYGSNLGLTVLLLLVLLITVNVVVAKKVPNKLDTTATGFYTISDNTKAFLANLSEPVALYIILPDVSGRYVNDVRQFAHGIQDAGSGHISVKFVSSNANKVELQRLHDKYPRLGRDDEGILITAGEDEKRNAFVPFADLFEMDMRTREPKAFIGENRIMRELRFLAENESKPVVYFTQGNGELSIGGEKEPRGQANTSASQLKAYLEKSYVDVRPLTFPTTGAAVPDDAAVVIVAEPQVPFSDTAASAIRKFMTAPRKESAKSGEAGDRKGKLIVLASALPGPDNRVVKTGLEGVLSEFNVGLGDKFVYSLPVQRFPSAKSALVQFAPAAVQNPIYQTIKPQAPALLIPMVREVKPLTANPQLQAVALLQTVPGRETWLEDQQIIDIRQTIKELGDPAVATRRDLSMNPRPIGVVVSEQSKGRLVVIGNAEEIVSDATRGGDTVTYDLVAVAIDWLRERPALTTADSKTYVTYRFPEASTLDVTRLVWLPLGLGLLIVTGLGAGVWIMRRK